LRGTTSLRIAFNALSFSANGHTRAVLLSLDFFGILLPDDGVFGILRRLSAYSLPSLDSSCKNDCFRCGI